MEIYGKLANTFSLYNRIRIFSFECLTMPSGRISQRLLIRRNVQCLLENAPSFSVKATQYFSYANFKCRRRILCYQCDAHINFRRNQIHWNAISIFKISSQLVVIEQAQWQLRMEARCVVRPLAHAVPTACELYTLRSKCDVEKKPHNICQPCFKSDMNATCACARAGKQLSNSNIENSPLRWKIGILPNSEHKNLHITSLSIRNGLVVWHNIFGVVAVVICRYGGVFGRFPNEKRSCTSQKNLKRKWTEK